MARLSAWLLLPLLCGSSLAKEGSVVPDFVDSSSSPSTHFPALSFPDAHLNTDLPFTPSTPNVNPLLRRSVCKPRQLPPGIVHSLVSTTSSIPTATSDFIGLSTSLAGSIIAKSSAGSQSAESFSYSTTSGNSGTTAEATSATLHTESINVLGSYSSTETASTGSTSSEPTSTQPTSPGYTKSDTTTSETLLVETTSVENISSGTASSHATIALEIGSSQTSATETTSAGTALHEVASSGSTSSEATSSGDVSAKITSSGTTTSHEGTVESEVTSSKPASSETAFSETTLAETISSVTSSTATISSDNASAETVSSGAVSVESTSAEITSSHAATVASDTTYLSASTSEIATSSTLARTSLSVVAEGEPSTAALFSTGSLSQESLTISSATAGPSSVESATITTDADLTTSVPGLSSTDLAVSDTSATMALSETSEALTPTHGSQSSEASLSLITTFPSSTFTSSDQTASETAVSTSTDSPLVLTVATDGSGDYTAIGDAIKAAQTSGYPTVTVLAGTYTENVVIQATPTVTIVGEVSKKRDGSSKVVIDNGGNANPALSFSTAGAAGITWRNIKFSNSQDGGSGGAVFLRGSKNAFYNCEFFAVGSVAITGSYASAIVANSYLEAQDKVIYNFPSLYLYGSTITATKANALLVYNKGALSGTTLYNTTVVFDTCDISQKSGATNTRVFLAAGNGDGSVAVFRDSSLGGFLAASGVYVDAKTQSSLNSYIEFGTTGDGSYSNHVSDRSKYVSLVTDPKDLSPYEISTFFNNVYPSVAVTSVDWIDPDVLSAIQASNAKDFPKVETSSTVASTKTSGATTAASDPLTTSNALAATSNTQDVTTSAAATTSASSCPLPSAVPSTALVVGPKSNPCASYDTLASAVAALPADDTTQTIYILAGTYQEKVSIVRVGATILRGETSDGTTYKDNKVTITASNAVLSSSGGSSGTATFSANKYEAKLVSFYNINFENSFAATTNNVALAVYAKGTKVAFYGCSIDSTQGTLYLDYGNFFFSHSSISGTTDFVWGQGAGYFYNSVIVSKGSSTGQAIAAHKYQGQYGGSQFVFDMCAVVPESSSVPEDSTYLGRDYSAKANVAFVNSFLDGHIAGDGWKVSSPSTFTGSFTEGNNTGPGYDSSARISAATVIKDTSSYSFAGILGSDAWIDKAAIAPFLGWPESKYGKDAVSVTTTSAATAASETTSATAVGNTLTVAPSPTGSQFKTVASALAAIPEDGEDYTVLIKAGTYNEQLTLNRAKGHVTLRGETSFENDFTQNEVLISFSKGFSTGAGRNEETPVLFWKTTSSAGLSLYNLNFTNTFEQTRDTAALAADFFGNMAAYGCAFKGFQDTMLVNQGVQVFSNSYLEGSVDFIWGYSKAYFHQCYIASNTAGAYVTAQNRKSLSWAGGFIFDTCKVTYTDSYGSSFGSTSLGRPWSQYALVVFMNSFLDKHISSAGWSAWSTSSPQTSDVLFGEFNNTGPGNWTSSRASFATKLTESQAAAYSLGSFIGSTSWLDMKAYNYAPSYTIGDSTAATDPQTDVSWPFHPSDGTTPPKNAVLVSVGGEKPDSYSSLTNALKSLPKDSTPQVIFIYPGSYEEQVPSINRPGPVTIIGYTESDPGKTYSSNQVTITQAKGLSVAGTIPAGRNNADTATIATASSKIAIYNVKFINTENLDGATPSYVTLAASVYGDKIGFYGCSFDGWQDTLLTGATAGYQYYESCMIGGAIDFVWGYSKAYFKGCTLGAKRAKSAITAQSRNGPNAVGGYIFDQCLFTEADSATADLQGQVYLGRPYSAYALVVVKNSYLDSTIQPAGWKIWSTADPRTDHVTFAEYANEGPGSWEKNVAAREAFGFATLLTKDDYSLETVMDSTDWIDKTHWDSITTPKPSTPVVPVPDPNAVYSGKTPPPGAYIVSQEAIEGVTTYDTIQAAINALPPSSKVTPTVFIYPGTYKEQIVLSRPGTTFFIGYSESPDDYTKNQVTITYDKGIDTQAEASNSDSATFYATGNYFQAVNINFENTFGTASNYASLGFGVKSSKFASLYGCQVYGNQDALLINGNLFAYNSLITGNIDMIWGSGAGYFLKSTLSPNKDKIALTANKKGTNTGAYGFVFDQCTVTPANGASFSTIYLGRPWDQFARVAYIESELSSCIPGVGWDDWTTADPRTTNVVFGEYANSGAGSSTSKRASFAKQLSDVEVAQFELGTFFPSTSWINMTLVNATPFEAGVAATQSVSLTTVYTTQTVTSSQTTLVTTTGVDVTVTEKSTSTQDIGTIITPDPVTKTTVEKTTTTEAARITQADKIVTVKSTEIVDVGKTVTPADVTETSTNVVDATVTSWVTTSAKAITTTATTTGATVTPKPGTEVVTDFTTIFATQTTSPKAVTVQSTTTITAGTGGTTTTSLKATTVLSTVVTTSVKTVAKTTTIKCIPTQDKRDLSSAAASIKPRAALVFGNPSVDLASGLTRRDLDLGSINLEARAAGASTVTVTVVSTFTTNVKTATTTIPGSTATTQVITTKVVGKTSTLKPVTVIDVSTSIATRYVTATIPGATSTTTVVTTKETGKTTTLKASTTTVVVQSTSVVTEKKTSTLPASTVTVYKTLTKTLPAETVRVTSTSTAKKTSIITLAAETVTKWATVKTTLKPSSTVTLRSTVSKTTTSVVKETKTTWATKTSKGAAACTN
ncbi:related to pectinesterase [Fusarium torulosum]|uniref:pectinesterase n=1 Tax=Fusarium torulosum TaxID=33205 RepID=A0AAE8M0N6_9HYPO|nr:related to pectinesterase [Fusarium torulosum]